MKKALTSLFILTALSLLVGCSGGNSSIAEDSSSPSDESSSIIEDQSSSSQVSSSSEAKSSSSEAKSSSSSAKSSSSSSSFKDNELSTSSGLTIKFKANGASIDTIKWGSTQIAKDGFTVGRVANRIANGKFSIDGTEYNVSKNNGNNTLHGGQGSGMNSWRGPFATRDWTKVEQTANSIKYSIESADGDNGFPGKMNMTVTYTLSEAGELSIEYSATTTKDTLCNPTNHLFFAINGNNQYSNINLQIDADKYTPLSNQLPTGEIASVTGTQFDYTTEKAFDGSKNYDDNLVLNDTGYRKVATLTGLSSKIKVDVSTDRPGLQLYKDGNGNICLETQMFPDMTNHPEFASYGTTILRANETFSSKTAYTFSKIS